MNQSLTQPASLVKANQRLPCVHIQTVETRAGEIAQGHRQRIQAAICGLDNIRHIQIQRDGISPGLCGAQAQTVAVGNDAAINTTGGYK